VPSFWSLEQITASPQVRQAQATGKFTVLFDSGIRGGCDVIKAVAMGAQGVLGMPFFILILFYYFSYPN